MTITLELKPEIEAQLVQPQSSNDVLSDEEWEATLMQIGNRQSLRKTPLSDEAISRESIYTREDEQL